MGCLPTYVIAATRPMAWTLSPHASVHRDLTGALVPRLDMTSRLLDVSKPQALTAAECQDSHVHLCMYAVAGAVQHSAY